MNTARLLTEVFMISLLASILTVLGCGVLPTGQGSGQITAMILQNHQPEKEAHEF
ncbi:hypothetical protein KIN20_015829 [Parelaphostrongylus tenuis]|uniref:Lipoprotein n=1 Tax=Parelaphostrongylus tenuis TaxID=148309 RepID=A0AAD5N4L5_PARTN|nr:hypothetical protein KIN20_015829 [Parelaphostrongylus tenuis]